MQPPTGYACLLLPGLLQRNMASPKRTDNAQGWKDAFSTLLVNWDTIRKITLKGNQKEKKKDLQKGRERDVPRLGRQRQKEDSDLSSIRAL